MAAQRPSDPDQANGVEPRHAGGYAAAAPLNAEKLRCPHPSSSPIGQRPSTSTNRLLAVRALPPDLPLAASLHSPPIGLSRPCPAFPSPSARCHWPHGEGRRRGREGGSAASPSSGGRRHGAAARLAAELRAAGRAGRAARGQRAAGRGAEPAPQRHRGRRRGRAARRLGLRRPARAARALHLPARGVRGVRGARGPRRERHGAAGAGPRLREAGRPGLRRRGAHAGAVPGAGRHRVRRAAELPARQPALRQVHGALLHNHSALLVLPGLLRHGPLLPGPHGHGRGEAADARRPRHLVVRGPHPAHHWRPHAQRRQQLVHGVLRAGGGRRGASRGHGDGPRGSRERLCGTREDLGSCSGH